MGGVFGGVLRGGDYDFPYRGVSGACTTVLPLVLSHFVFGDDVWLRTAPNGALFAGLVLSAVGVGWRAWAHGYLSAAVISDRSMHTKLLVTEGPYSVTRNPLYVGTYCLALSVGCATNAFWLCVVVCAATVRMLRLIDAEERHFTRTQSSAGSLQYASYCARVPRLMPNNPKRLLAALQQRTAPVHWWRGVVSNGSKSLIPLMFLVALCVPLVAPYFAWLPLVWVPLSVWKRVVTADARHVKANADISAATNPRPSAAAN